MAQRYNQNMDSDASTVLPAEFTNRLEKIVVPAAFGLVMAAFSSDRPTTFRVNTLKTTAAVLRESLNRQGFETKDVDWYPDAFILENKSLRELSETAEYKTGQLYVQSLSSMLPPLILDPKPGEKVLDIAAAPGSKTTQMAGIMENKGQITANDASRIRIYRLEANLKLQGATIARITHEDARAVWQKSPEYYDKTLVDVPCSMEGRFISSDPKSYQDWSVKKVRELSRLQRWILRSAVSATKPGGTIVYSTCTLSPEENEEVIDWLLKKEKGNVVLSSITMGSLSFDPVISSWEGKTYDPTLQRTARIYPSNYMEGFYIAKLKKAGSTLPKAMRTTNAV